MALCVSASTERAADVDKVSGKPGRAVRALAQRFMPETTAGPDTLLHGDVARGPYLNSMRGSWAVDDDAVDGRAGRACCCPGGPGGPDGCPWRAFHDARIALERSSSYARKKKRARRVVSFFSTKKERRQR